MPSVRIKYYGLFWMTKRTYFILLSAAAGFAVAAMLFALLIGGLPPLGWPWAPKPIMKETGFGPFVVNHFYFIVLVCLVAQLIDTLMILRAFAKKEAEQRAMFDALELEGQIAAPESKPEDGIRPAPSIQPDGSRTIEPHS